MPVLANFSTKSLFRSVRIVRDLFARTTSGTLGTSTSEAVWSNIRGTWFSNGSQAQSNDTGANYALAAVELGSEKQSVSLSGSPGVGPAVWVSNSNNWHAGFGHSTTSTVQQCGGGSTGNIFTSQIACSCGSSTSGTGCGGGSTGNVFTSPPSCTCGSQTSGNVCAGPATGNVFTSPQSCACGSQTSGSSCGGGATAWQGSQPTCSCGTRESRTNTTHFRWDGGGCPSGSSQVPCGNCTGSPCGTMGFVCCRQTTTEWRCTDSSRTLHGCSSTSVTRWGCSDSTRTLWGCSDSLRNVTSEQHWLRIVSSVGGTVSTATGDISLTSSAAAIRVVANENTITATAFSDVSMTTTLGTNTVTLTSPVRGVWAGIVKAPSSHNQGSTAGNFRSEAL